MKRFRNRFLNISIVVLFIVFTNYSISLAQEDSNNGRTTSDLSAERMLQVVEHGKQVFKTNCKACHQIGRKFVGPALKGLEERRSKEWIYDFVKSSQSMIKANDETAVQLFDEYNQVLMPDQPVSNDDIDAILEYIKAEVIAENDPSKNPIKRPFVEAKVVNNHFRFSNYLFWIPYTVFVIILIAALYQMTIIHDLYDKLDE